MDTYIGMALGGTSLTLGEIDASGIILGMKRYQPGFFNQESALDIMCQAYDDYRRHVGFAETPRALGAGVIGRVDYEHGVWHQIDPDRTSPIGLAQELAGRVGLPCYVDNDVKASARAVLRWGFGQQSRNLIYLYVGTGIAASVIVEGCQIRGSHFNAGEVGHMRVGVPVGVRCPCGRMDCVETIASSIGIDRCARHLQSRYATRLEIPAPPVRVQVTDVFRLSQEGDPLCAQLVDNAAEALANLIMNLVRVSDPDLVVLGGEMVADGFLLQQVMPRLHPVTMRFVTHGVVVTKLNPQFISLLGAGALAIDGLERDAVSANNKKGKI